MTKDERQQMATWLTHEMGKAKTDEFKAGRRAVTAFQNGWESIRVDAVGERKLAEGKLVAYIAMAHHFGLTVIEHTNTCERLAPEMFYEVRE